MQVFKAAVKAFFRHPIYLLIYVVWLSCMGVFMGLSVNEADTYEYYERPTVAIIDRDGSALAEGLSAFVLSQSDPVEVADDERALQDAIMQQQAHYIAIIPEGFGESFAAYAAGVGKMPRIETILSTQSASVSMMDNLVAEYLNVARAYELALPDAGETAIVKRIDAAMAEGAEVSVVQTTDTAPVSQGYLLYLQFTSYTILLAIAVCTAVVMSRFGRDEVRRRNEASPVPALSINLQLAAACFVIMLVCWAFVSALGLAVYGGRLAGTDPAAIVNELVTLLCYSLFGLAFGFLVGQITRNELIMNATSNIVGLVISFLGGMWVSLDLVGEPIATIAKFTPTYYYGEAVKGTFDPAYGAFSPYVMQNIGIVCLFALTLFAIGLAIGRWKVGRMGAWKSSSTKLPSQPAA